MLASPTILVPGVAMAVTAWKGGDSLGVRIPKVIARQSSIRQGSELEVSTNNGRVLLRPVEVPSLSQLLGGMKKSNRPDQVKCVDWRGRRAQQMKDRLPEHVLERVTALFCRLILPQEN